MHQAEYWGYNYLPYCNIDNFRFPIRGYTWNPKSNDPTHWDWTYIPQAITAWKDVYSCENRSRRNRNGDLPKNHMNNYYERYYPQAFVESWHFPWLLGIDSHRLVDYSHPPIAKVIESHALYRAICFKEGWSLDYTKFYPEYSLKMSLVDSESWLCPYGQKPHPSLFNDVFLFA